MSTRRQGLGQRSRGRQGRSDTYRVHTVPTRSIPVGARVDVWWTYNETDMSWAPGRGLVRLGLVSGAGGASPVRIAA